MRTPFLLHRFTSFALGCMLVALGLSCAGKRNNQKLTDNPDRVMFQKPEKNHYPETWFHFIGGNVSKEGITADLEAIAKAGLSGIQLFHGQFGGEWPGVSPQITALSESWDELIVWTAEECERLNLNFTMQNCPGWSYAGGPWIEPENAMRHMVHARKDIEGGQRVNLSLAQPQPSNEEWRNYQDLFVIAFPTPEGDSGERLIPSRLESNRAELPWDECLIRQKPLQLPPSLNEPTTIDVMFGEETTIRTVEFPSINSFSHAWCYSPDVKVTVYAAAGEGWQQIASLDMPPGSWQDDQPISIACEEATAQSFRLEIENLHDMHIAFINFYGAARQQNWESEAGWTLRRIVREDFPRQSPTAWVDPSAIMDISEKMSPEGVLSWDAPQGKWTVLRIGHVNTGMRNGPAPAEATGWEADKLSPAGARANFDGYIGRLIRDNSSLKNGLLNGILIDSWECKTQTWTTDLDLTFNKKWNYTLFSMFPALFGYVVDNPETTARFLRDWRVTLNDLLVENFFGEMGHIAGENGLKISFETASGDVFPGDILEYYKYADVPMCEFWHPRSESFVGSFEFKPVRPCVSASRMYGKGRTAAEAFTSFDLTWNEHPRFLKDIADEHLAMGVTHMVFHTYTHNPRTDFLPPSTSFGSKIGTPFLRLQSWWEHMPFFTDYLARCNYMLESGLPVSDVLMYLGDEQNHKPPQSLPFPHGFAYDYCNPDVLLNRLSVKDGRLVTPEGITYRALWLYDCKRMLPETLEKINSFAQHGVLIVGEPPMGLATLGGGEETAIRFRKAVEELWGDGSNRVRKVGKGKVYNTSIDEALASECIGPDIHFESSGLRWLHRKTNRSDIYFLSAPATEGFAGTISFRCEGNADIWDPITGDTRSIATTRKGNGHSQVTLDIQAGSSCFVVFSQHAPSVDNSLSITERKDLSLGWEVNFPSGWGIDSSPIEIEGLMPWCDFPSLNEEGAAFSGTATYRSSFDMVDIDTTAQYILELGRVEMIAQVKLNGELVDTRWTYPYEVDISRYLLSGDNELEVSVTSTWFNRLAFDAGLPEGERKTWTIEGPVAGAALKEYGLLGPVFISRAE